MCWQLHGWTHLACLYSNKPPVFVLPQAGPKNSTLIPAFIIVPGPVSERDDSSEAIQYKYSTVRYRPCAHDADFTIYCISIQFLTGSDDQPIIFQDLLSMNPHQSTV